MSFAQAFNTAKDLIEATKKSPDLRKALRGAFSMKNVVLPEEINETFWKTFKDPKMADELIEALNTPDASGMPQKEITRDMVVEAKKNYMPTVSERALVHGINALGNTSKVLGNAFGLRDASAGALFKVLSALVPQSKREVYGASALDLLSGVSPLLSAKGQLNTQVGQLLGNTANNVAQDIDSMQKRAESYAINELHSGKLNNNFYAMVNSLNKQGDFKAVPEVNLDANK